MTVDNFEALEVFASYDPGDGDCSEFLKLPEILVDDDIYFVLTNNATLNIGGFRLISTRADRTVDDFFASTMDEFLVPVIKKERS